MISTTYTPSRASGITMTVSMLIAYWLSYVSLPTPWDWARPQWVVLVVLYWILIAPHQFGVLFAWSAGLILDVLYADTLGQNALALAIIGYFAYLLHLRLRAFPLWQQSLVIFILVGCFQLIMRFMEDVLGSAPKNMWYYLSSLTSAIVWPWLLSGLNGLRR